MGLERGEEKERADLSLNRAIFSPLKFTFKRDPFSFLSFSLSPFSLRKVLELGSKENETCGSRVREGRNKVGCRSGRPRIVLKEGKFVGASRWTKGGGGWRKGKKQEKKGGKVTPEGSPFEQRAVSQAGNASGRRLAATQTFQTTRLPAYVKRLARDTQVTQLKRPSCNGERWRNRKKQTDVSGRRMYAIYIYIYIFSRTRRGNVFLPFRIFLPPPFLSSKEPASGFDLAKMD